eukprot:357017-Chlamydomonas_euryale.AAC.4
MWAHLHADVCVPEALADDLVHDDALARDALLAQRLQQPPAFVHTQVRGRGGRLGRGKYDGKGLIGRVTGGAGYDGKLRSRYDGKLRSGGRGRRGREALPTAWRLPLAWHAPRAAAQF